MRKVTYLYRFFDVNGRLLYVGISYHIESRLDAHRHQKPWGEVAQITVEAHPTREEALVAERRAIQREKPAWNLIHSSLRSAPKRTNFAAVAKQRWPHAEWIAGQGPYATLAHCRDALTIMLHKEYQQAQDAFGRIRRLGCGGFCVGDHELLDLGADEESRGVDTHLYPKCHHCRTRLVEWFFSWDDKPYCPPCFETLDLPPPIARPRPVDLAELMSRPRPIEW